MILLDMVITVIILYYFFKYFEQLRSYLRVFYGYVGFIPKSLIVSMVIGILLI